MSYPNLQAEMKRKGLLNKDIAECLNVTANTVSRMMSGKSSITLGQAFAINDSLFGGTFKIEYLFKKGE